MRLNLQTDYALRLLMHLAANTQGLVTIADVANRFRISRAHLMKVAFLLGKGGFVQTVRGGRAGCDSRARLGKYRWATSFASWRAMRSSLVASAQRRGIASLRRHVASEAFWEKRWRHLSASSIATRWRTLP